MTNATSRNNLVAAQLDNNAPSFRNRLYNLLVNYHNYTTFSNEAWIPQNNINNFDSIESIHDAIHGLTGSGGHMTYIDYSAFDPIFWLHHAMIDRTFALWQVLNPDSYVVPQPSKYKTYASPAGSTQDINTPLTPFHNSTSGTFWNSQTARFTETFGYTYAETANSNGLSSDQMKTQVTAAINTLYGATAPAATRPKAKRSHNSTDDSLGPAKGATYREWIANIVVRKNALLTPFFIHIFLGPFNPDPFSWSFEPNLIGTHCIYVKAGKCESCNFDPEQKVTASLPLTHTLMQKIHNGTLASLDPKDVDKYLIENLKYRVTLLDDTPVPNDSVQDLNVTVVSSVVKRAESQNQFPKWGRFQEHFQADGCS
jgi:tyrosinase